MKAWEHEGACVCGCEGAWVCEGVCVCVCVGGMVWNEWERKIEGVRGTRLLGAPLPRRQGGEWTH